MLTEFKKYLQTNSDLTDEQFSSLKKYITTKILIKNNYLLQPGAICSHSIFVSKGLLRSYTIDTSGKEHIIQFAPENWFISDRGSLFFNEPSSIYIDSIEDSEVVLLENEFITEASRMNLSFQVYNNFALQNHIRHLQNRVNLLLGATAEQRYLDFITIYPNLTLRIPQWMMASYLGITPETLSRVRKELARRNFKPY